MKKTKYILTMLLSCIFLFGMTGCANASSVKLSSTKVTVDIQSSQKVTLKGVSSSKKASITTSSSISKKKKTTKYIYWAVSSPTKASIKAKGNAVTITGRAKGSTTVKARYNGKTYTCSVIIQTPEEQAVFDPAEINLEGTNIPDYWNDEIADSVGKAKGRMDSNTSTILYLTDVHWSAENNTMNSPAIVNYLTDELNTPFTIFGGDVISSVYKDSKAKAENEIQDFYKRFTCNIFSTIGNHDRNMYNNTAKSNKKTWLYPSDLYRLMFAQEESFAKITKNNVNYSYVDDKDHNIRYINFYYDVKNPDVYTKTTQNWIDKRVKELSSDWTVILISHGYWDYASVKKTPAPTKKSKAIASHMLSLQKSSKANIAGWFVGHTHRDIATTLTSSDGESRLNIVSVKADALAMSNKVDSKGSMVKGTDMEQTINIMQINTEKHRIYITRVGSGSDRILYY